jgi:hypothetical protein
MINRLIMILEQSMQRLRSFKYKNKYKNWIVNSLEPVQTTQIQLLVIQMAQ